MTHHFEPFTPELFKKETGMEASENEAVYVRWVNTQVNYANYKSMSEMSESLKEIIRLLTDNQLVLSKKEDDYPFSK